MIKFQGNRFVGLNTYVCITTFIMHRYNTDHSQWTVIQGRSVSLIQAGRTDTTLIIDSNTVILDRSTILILDRMDSYNTDLWQ